MEPIRGDTIYEVERIKLLNKLIAKIKEIEGSIPIQIQQAVDDLVNGAPAALDTLREIVDNFVQSDWNQSDSSKLDFIKNKPNIPNAQIQSDWEQEDNTKSDFIKNKPDIDEKIKDKLYELVPNVMGIDAYSYGIEWDITNTNPVVKRVGNMLMHQNLPIQSAFRGCICIGNQIQYYLDPSDWSKKEDGTPSNLDGTDGTVRIHTPKFYGRSFVNGNKRQVRISEIKIDDSWIEIPELVIDAYKCTLDRRDNNNIKTASVKNTNIEFRGGNNNSAYDVYLATDPARTQLGKPVTNISRATMRNYANNDNSEILCYEFYKWIFYWCPIIEYANFFISYI